MKTLCFQVVTIFVCQARNAKKNHVLHNEKLSLPHYPSFVETILLYKA